MRSEMWQRIRAARKRAGFTQEKLGELCNVSKAAVAQWEATTADRRTSPSRESVYKIHKATGAPVAWLYDDSIDANKPWNLFQDAYNPRDKDMVPLISWDQAGALIETDDIYAPNNVECWLPCPQSHGNKTFALRIKGNVMTSPYPGQRDYPEGTLIYVDPDAAFYDGRRVVAKLLDTDEVTFKVYAEDAGRRFLRPLNPQYPTLELHDGFRILGVVIGSYLSEQ